MEFLFFLVDKVIFYLSGCDCYVMKAPIAKFELELWLAHPGASSNGATTSYRKVLLNFLR